MREASLATKVASYFSKRASCQSPKGSFSPTKQLYEYLFRCARCLRCTLFLITYGYCLSRLSLAFGARALVVFSVYWFTLAVAVARMSRLLLPMRKV